MKQTAAMFILELNKGVSKSIKFCNKQLHKV